MILRHAQGDHHHRACSDRDRDRLALAGEKRDLALVRPFARRYPDRARRLLVLFSDRYHDRDLGAAELGVVVDQALITDPAPRSSRSASPKPFLLSDSHGLQALARLALVDFASTSISFTAAINALSSKPHSAYNSACVPCSMKRSGMPSLFTCAW